MLISNQIRAARGLLHWSARVLAERAGVHLSTVQRMERSQGPVGGNVESVRRVQAALERAGVGFLAEDDSPGVRLLKADELQSVKWSTESPGSPHPPVEPRNPLNVRLGSQARQPFAKARSEMP